MGRFYPSERVDPGQLAPDHELVDGFGAFVGDHAFQVQHVPNRLVFSRDTAASQYIPAVPRDIQGHPHIVPLGDADLRRLHFSGVLQTPELQGQQLCGGDPPRHVGQPDLDRLVGGQRASEQHAVRRVGNDLVQAGNRGAIGPQVIP